MILWASIAAAIWIAVCIAALKEVGLWEWDNLKTSIIWTLTFACVTMFDVNRISEESTYFSKTLKDTINATAIITFIAEFYSFGISIEMILVPSLIFFGMLYVVAKANPDHRSVARIMFFALILGGLGYLMNGIHRIALDVDSFATWKTLREFSIPSLLSLFFVPFLYCFSVYVTYETNLIRLDLLVEDAKARRRLKRHAISVFRLDLGLLRQWSRELMQTRPSSEREIRGTIEAAKLWRRGKRIVPSAHSDSH